MTPGRLRVVSVLAIVAVHGVALLAWTQSWVAVTLADGPQLVALGDAAAPALPALALAGIALAGALTIAGVFFRFVLGLLQVLLGATITITSVLAATDPIAAASASIGEATGLDGTETLQSLVVLATTTAWPWLAAAAGAVGVVLGAFVVVTARRWPESGRKYRAVSLQRAESTTPRVDDWDAISDGRDPTG